MSSLRVLTCLLCPAVLAGCYTTTVRSGRLAEARPATVVEDLEVANFDARFHHGFINGIIEVGGNYNLDRICPAGWAEITTERDVLSGLLHFATLGIYSPQTITIRCAAQGLPGYTPSYLQPSAAPPALPLPPPPPR